MKTYTLKKNKATGELHLFEAGTSNTPKGKCIVTSHSICKKMENTEYTENIFSCASAKLARQECAELGELVCGHGVSYLYASY
jgi:hypothetical protein